LLLINTGFTLYDEKPLNIREDYDKKIISEIFIQLKDQKLLGREIYCNQVYSAYLLSIEKGIEIKCNYTRSDLEKSSKGSIFIYDYHYTFRPGYGGDTRLKDFTQNPDFKALTAYRFPDRIISFAIFEKINYFKE
jgi:hypothetical protein